MSNLNSLLFYILSFSLIFIITLIFDNIKNKGKMIKGIYFFAIFMVMYFISGYRYNVGWDYKAYIDMYSSYNYLDKGSVLLFSISNLISNEPQTIIKLYSLLTITFFILFLNKRIEKEKISYIIGSFLFVVFPMSFNGIRQYLAITIILYAVELMKEKKTKVGLLFYILAVFMHNSAIIFVPYLFILLKGKKNCAKKIYILTLLVSIGLILFTSVLGRISVMRKYLGYMEMLSLSNTNYNLIISYVPFISLLALFYKTIKKDENIKIYTSLFLSGIFLEIVFSSTEVSRIGLYLSAYLILLFPKLLEKIKKFNTRIAVKCLYYTLLVIYFVLVFYIVGRAKVFPYNNILFLS